MTEPKKFTRGKHTYTRWGPNFKEVRLEKTVEKQKVEPAAPTSFSVDVDDATAQGVYSNTTLVHMSEEEVVLDFVYLFPGQGRGRVRSRVIIPLAHVGKLSTLLQQTSQLVKKNKSRDK